MAITVKNPEAPLTRREAYRLVELINAMLKYVPQQYHGHHTTLERDLDAVFLTAAEIEARDSGRQAGSMSPLGNRA